MGSNYAYGLWTVVLFNIALFLFFGLSFIRPRGKREWRSMGVFSAFLVALFTEMYGFPLTIYLLTSVLGSRYPIFNPFTHTAGNLWAVLLGGSTLLANLFMGIGGIITVAALMILSVGWRQIHNSKGELVTDGIYGFVRHPQYSALFLLILGFMIQWPTFITVLMLPVLVFTYYRLARREERDMQEHFGEAYGKYHESVPMFLPRFRSATAPTNAKPLRAKV